jgi:O-antigen/teichoic acid export membrane protein
MYRISGCHLGLWRSSAARAASLMKDSWPLIFSGIVTKIYMRIDQVMLREMVSPEEVGIYSASVRIAEVWYFIPMALSASVVPNIIQAKVESDELFFGKLQKFYNVMAFIGYVVAIPVCLLSQWLVELLFGAPYARAGLMLALLVWGGMFVNLGIARSAFLTTMNWTKVHFFTVFLGAVVNVLLNLLLIPHYGGMGAVIASCVAYWLAGHGSCYLYRPLFKTGNMLTRAIIYPRFW